MDDEIREGAVSPAFDLSHRGATKKFAYCTAALAEAVELASIGYTGNVNAVGIVGLDDFGGSPGFDLAFVQGLEGSSVITAPEPGTLALLGLGLGLGLVGLGSSRRRKA